MSARSLTNKLIAAILIGSMAVCLAACGGNDTEESTNASDVSATDVSDAEATTTTTTVATATTLTEYSGPLASNDVSVSWEETDLESEQTKYCTVSSGEFLNIRKGPGSDYDRVGKLSRGQSVKVVAKTSNGWYKTFDGFYVSSEYLSDTQP